MLTFTFANGRAAEAENLHAFMDRHFPPGLAIDAVWTGNTTDAALLLLPRDASHAFIALSRIDGPDVSLGGRESELIATGRMADPFEIPSSGATGALRNRLHSAMESMGLVSSTSVSPQTAPTYTTQGDGFTRPLPAAPLAVETPVHDGPEQADHPARLRSRVADPAEDQFISRATGEPATSFLCENCEPSANAAPVRTSEVVEDAFNKWQKCGECEALITTTVPSAFRSEASPVADATRLTTAPATATPEAQTSRSFPVRKPAVTDDGAPTARRGSAAERLDALANRSLDPDPMRALPVAPVPRVGRRL